MWCGQAPPDEHQSRTSEEMQYPSKQNKIKIRGNHTHSAHSTVQSDMIVPLRGNPYEAVLEAHMVRVERVRPEILTDQEKLKLEV